MAKELRSGSAAEKALHRNALFAPAQRSAMTSAAPGSLLIDPQKPFGASHLG
jgi:hypothetical protein